jgi:integrase
LIAEFFCKLHEEDGYVSGTIAGYRTAISHVLKSRSSLDVGNDPHLKDLLANFERDTTRVRDPVPKWDLALVLHGLTQAPFEPLGACPLMFCTLKTVFLVTLASGKRRSEIHALTRKSLKRDELWETVTLAPEMSFIAKTELVNRGSGILREVEIKALGPFLGHDMEEDRMLCPVRALRIYLDRTDHHRSETQRKLFISVQQNCTKDISKNTVSGWLKRTIAECYKGATPDAMRLFKAKAHDVRAMSASWAFMKGMSLESIMGACSWKAHSTFTNYYLRDLTRIHGNMLCLGPVVVAQQKI